MTKFFCYGFGSFAKVFVCLLLHLFLFTTPTPLFAEQKQFITLATTTSTENSGLLEFINPIFEKQTGIGVKVIALGTGAAIKTAKDGNADLILVHAKPQEEAFVASGFGVERFDVFYNDFVIIGPKEDPANINGIKDVAVALRKIAENGTKCGFVSRGDESGTHFKEQSLWKASGTTLLGFSSETNNSKDKPPVFRPEGRWYYSIGQSMGAAITFAFEKQFYTIADRGTFLAFVDKIDLKVLLEGDKRLFNPYGIIAVNPKKYPQTKYDLAKKYINWIVSEKTQKTIASFKVDGKTLFFPNAEAKR